MYDVGRIYVCAIEYLLSEFSQIYFIKQNTTIMSCSPIFLDF